MSETRMGRPPKRICIRGHDTAETGRYSNGRCRLCQTTGKRSGQPRQRYCLRGHDTSKWGRAANGQCRRCKNDANASPEPKIDPVPLRVLAHNEAYAALLWSNTFGTTDGTAHAAAKRLWVSETIPLHAADRWCIALQTHLVNVYPTLYAEEAV